MFLKLTQCSIVTQVIGPGFVGAPRTKPARDLDGLAVAYLSDTGLLDDLRRSAREFQVHPSTVTEIGQLIRMEAESQRTLEVVSQLRIWLRDGIATGRVTVMPRPQSAEVEDMGI